MRLHPLAQSLHMHLLYYLQAKDNYWAMVEWHLAGENPSAHSKTWLPQCHLLHH